jgi:VWFA-related protein
MLRQKGPSLRTIGLSTSRSLALLLILVFVLTPGIFASAQQSSDQQQTQAPPEAGGPQGDVGPIAIPKKTPENTPPPPPPPKPQRVEGMPDYSVRVDVPLVNLDVMVVTDKGQFVPGIPKGNFRVYEDNVEQKITSFSQTEAPITAVLLVEFAATNYYFMVDALNASYTFANTLKKDDWVAVVAYDMRPTILVDFTQDKNAVYGALRMLRIPGFSETNLFDALYDTLDRVDRLEGRKVVVLIGSGRDTFSKLTLDKILKKVKDTPNVTIFTISTGRAFLERVDARAGNSPYVRELMMDYLQADNQMNAIAKLTGGQHYNPRFLGEFPEIFRDVGAAIRNQYTLSYKPTNSAQDGSYRKLKVELVAPDGKPFVIKDEKGKTLKYKIIAREGYTAKNVVD